MYLHTWNKIKAIKKNGWFENCNYLPSKLTSVYIEQKYREVEYFDDGTPWPYPRYLGNGNHIDYYVGVDVVSNESKQGYPFSCDIEACQPQPINPIEAKKRMLYLRKYGYKSYLRKYKMKPNQKLQFAIYNKMLVAWDNFGVYK